MQKNLSGQLYSSVKAHNYLMIALLLANFISAPKYSICFSYSLRTEGHVRLISVTYF